MRRLADGNYEQTINKILVLCDKYWKSNNYIEKIAIKLILKEFIYSFQDKDKAFLIEALNLVGVQIENEIDIAN